MKPIILPALALGALAIAAAGCRHKGFDTAPDTDTRVSVAFNWQYAPAANPAGMSVYFYETATGRARRFDFAGGTGGTVTLPQGKWHVLTYNNDTPGIQFGSAHDFSSHYAFTREGNLLEGALGNGVAPTPPTAEGTGGERVVITPDMLWGDVMTDHVVEILPGEREHVVTLSPRQLVCHYSYEIRNVSNLHHVVKLCGALTSMSPSVKLSDGTLSQECVTLPFATSKKDETTVCGEFYTFGHHDANADPHRMMLYIWMDDGRKLAYGTTRGNEWDVTDQIHNAADPKRVHIVLDNLDIPYEYGQGGFDPSADDWGTEYRGIQF